MADTVNINFKADRRLKDEFEDTIGAMGLNTTTALNLFMRQVARKRAIPFEIDAPSPWEETLAALDESEKILDGGIKAKSYSSAEEMCRDILGEDYA